jgi:hypothetical protein
MVNAQFFHFYETQFFEENWLFMMYMVVETFRSGKLTEVYQRFREHGRMAPAGVHYLASWVDHSLERCFQVMEAENEDLLHEWMAHWDDLVEFDVIPVHTSEQAAVLVANLGQPK